MDAPRIINLIPAKPEESPQTGIIMAFAQRLSLWALAIFLVSGVVIGGAYYYLKLRYDQLVITRQELSQIITQNATKEGLLVSIKQRTALITKIFSVQQPIGDVFDMIVPYVTPGQISDVSMDDKNNVSLSVHVASIDDAVAITDALIKQTAANRVRAPQLDTLQLTKTGIINVRLSFVAVF